MENDELKNKMNELFRLFKKVMEKFPPHDVPGMDKSQLEQLKMYLSQYDAMKDNFSVEIFGMMDNDMTRNIIDMLIKKPFDKVDVSITKKGIINLGHLY